MTTCERLDDNDWNPPCWFDFRPSAPSVPHHVEFLRIGHDDNDDVDEDRFSPQVFALPGYFCQIHPRVRWIQLHVDCISDIPVGAFYNCPFLERVEFVLPTRTRKTRKGGRKTRASSPRAVMTNQTPRSSALRSIGGYSFRRCKRLHTVTGLEHVAQSLKTLGEYAFADCTALSNIGHLAGWTTRLEHLGNGALRNCPECLTTLDPSKLVHLVIGPHVLFAHHQSPRLPAVVSGNNCHLSRCPKLTTITFQSKKSLSTKCPRFGSCQMLHTVELPHRIPRILWPHLLAQLLQYTLPSQLGITNPANQHCIVWNFWRRNLADFYVQEKTACKKPFLRRGRVGRS